MTTFDIDRLGNAEIVDQKGEKIGQVGQIYLDDATNQPTFVTVKTGLFGTRETFVPLNAATVNGDTITVPYTKDFVKDAPSVDADGHIDENEQAEIQRYYAGNTAGYDRREGVTDTTAVAGTDVNRDRTDVADVDRDRTTDENGMLLHEERVNVGTQKVETGQVRLRKHVVTEQQTVTVPVQREEVQVVREPVSGDVRGNGTLSEDEQVVTLTEERPVVTKETVATERVGLQKNVVTEQQQVQTEVGREEVVVENGTVANGTVADDGKQSLKDRIEDKFDRK